MYQSWKEEEMIREWLTTQHIPTLAKRLGFDPGKLYRLQSGSSKLPSYNLVRELYLEKQKQESQNNVNK